MLTFMRVEKEGEKEFPSLSSFLNLRNLMKEQREWERRECEWVSKYNEGQCGEKRKAEGNTYLHILHSSVGSHLNKKSASHTWRLQLCSHSSHWACRCVCLSHTHSNLETRKRKHILLNKVHLSAEAHVSWDEARLTAQRSDGYGKPLWQLNRQ